jgi:hypothetical protein
VSVSNPLEGLTDEELMVMQAALDEHRAKEKKKEDA